MPRPQCQEDAVCLLLPGPAALVAPAAVVVYVAAVASLPGAVRRTLGELTARGVGDRGFEPRTSALSERRSNRLS